MANQKMGGCKKRRRAKVVTSNIKKSRAGRNMKPRCSFPLLNNYVREMRRIDDMPVEENKMLTHQKRFESLPKRVRKAIYSVVRYPY